MKKIKNHYQNEYDDDQQSPELAMHSFLRVLNDYEFNLKNDQQQSYFHSAWKMFFISKQCSGPHEIFQQLRCWRFTQESSVQIGQPI